MNSELPSFIGCSQDNPALSWVPSPSNHQRFSHQFGMASLFDRRKKAVHVDVEDSSHQLYFTIPSQLF
jgi:hypothetical protein